MTINSSDRLTGGQRGTMLSAATEVGRRRFLQLGGLGLLASFMAACGDLFGREPEGPLGEGTVEGSVIVVGAGPAGMTAAHLLRQRGADVRVLEARSTPGGRIAHTRDFVDFPISLGGEWLHVDRAVLDDIVADESVRIDTVTVGYREDGDFAMVDDDGELVALSLADTGFDIDQKFVGSSWLDFFETYVLPGIAPLITFDTPVERIEYGEGGVRLTDTSGDVHEADRVVVTVPVAILQQGLVEFEPPLPDDRLDTLAEARVWSGFKAFIEFDRRFYPTLLAPADSGVGGGQRLFYDAAHGQDSAAHVLGVFSVGEEAERYQAAGEGAIDLILAELDEIYDGTATEAYVQHLTQDWNAQPWARGAYLTDDEDFRTTRRLTGPIDDVVFFAGDGYTAFDDWSSVHAAAWSARDAVRAMLG
ncbi:MAG: FAD-dependent oxidoreductase [Actinomycetota bacterium]